MNKVKLLFLLTILILGAPAHSEQIKITLLQLNDVYEITPVAGGKAGGLARVATLRKRLLAENPHTFTLLAGDCLSPSALGTAKVDGERLAGKQMVAVLNEMGLDYATFGNHEFDISEAQFHQRLKESRFQWLSSNVDDAQGKPFSGVPRSQIISIPTDEEKTVKIGLIGLSINSNPADYVSYRDPITVAREQAANLKVDILIALTHLQLSHDQALIEAVPEIDLVLGGHEHENIQQWRGADFTPLFKADANARTVYIHQLNYDTDSDQLTIQSHIQPITDLIPEDPTTAELAHSWQERGFAGFREQGFVPEKIVATINVPLDGHEASVRDQSTNLTQLIAESMRQAVEDADLAIYNSGSIRIDDVIPPGPVTQYDVIRILPFGGKVLAVSMQGKLLKKVLDQGQANRGTGGYLQTANVESAVGVWHIDNKPLESGRSYRVAINDFLLSGKETGLNYLTPDNPGLIVLEKKGDVRFALIQGLQTGLVGTRIMSD